jgi:hypothetical protein
LEVELQDVYDGDAQPLVPIELADMSLAGSDTVALTDTYFEHRTA